MEFNKKDFKVIYTRGTGPGGQNKNKVETCVVVTHIASGLSERCEDTRHRAKNEKMAFERLEKRLIEIIKLQQHNKKNKEKIELLNKAGRIKTYNFQRNEVKDHRNGKIAPLDKVLDGDLDLLK